MRLISNPKPRKARLIVWRSVAMSAPSFELRPVSQILPIVGPLVLDDPETAPKRVQQKLSYTQVKRMFTHLDTILASTRAAVAEAKGRVQAAQLERLAGAHRPGGWDGACG